MDTEIAEIAKRAVLISHGSITVVFQDMKLINMEVTEKIRFSGGSVECAIVTGKDADILLLANRLAKLFRGLAYGKIVLFIKNGKVIQYSRQEQYRLNDLGEGL